MPREKWDKCTVTIGVNARPSSILEYWKVWNQSKYNFSTSESNYIFSNQFWSGLVLTKLSTRVGIEGHFD